MTIITTTPRLILRELTVQDAEDFFELNTNPNVLRYTGDSPFASIRQAATFLANYTHYSIHGFGRWAVIHTQTNTFLGWCGLKLHEEGFVDLGFRLFEKEWGHGYATEAAQASLKYGFEHVGLDEIIGRASKQNKASINILHKLGMTFWKHDTCDGVANAAYYKLIRESYNSKPLRSI